MRINACLTSDFDTKVDFLLQKTGLSITDLIKDALNQYYNKMISEESVSYRIIAEAGFIACGESDEKLSPEYKNMSADKKSGQSLFILS